MNFGRGLKVASAVALATGAGLLTTMPPASAAGSGISMGETSISEFGSGPPVCLGAKPGMSLVLYSIGTFTAQTTSGAQVFEGKTQTDFKANGTGTGFYFNPAGTFKDSACTIPTAAPPPKIVGTLTVTTVTAIPGPTSSNPPNVGTVSCTAANASYNRVGNEYVVTTATGTNSCTVTNSALGAAQTSASTLVFTGNQNPCFDGAPFDPCQVPNTELAGTYTQTP